MKTRDEEWFADDQAQWHEDQKRDEEELHKVREEEYRGRVMEEVIMEFKQRYMARLQEEAAVFGRACYGKGFLHGFIAALLGAVVFFFIV